MVIKLYLELWHNRLYMSLASSDDISFRSIVLKRFLAFSSPIVRVGPEFCDGCTSGIKLHCRHFPERTYSGVSAGCQISCWYWWTYAGCFSWWSPVLCRTVYKIIIKVFGLCVFCTAQKAEALSCFKESGTYIQFVVSSLLQYSHRGGDFKSHDFADYCLGGRNSSRNIHGSV